MSQIAVVKVGSTFPELAEARGDFEDWILFGLALGRDRAMIVDVAAEAPLPDYESVSGAVVTGSHASVTEHAPWSERTAAWLAGAVARQVPLLGICYGHQLLAYALGGEVVDNPRGRAFGLVEVRLAPAAGDDALLVGFPPLMPVHVAHRQSVLRLPAGAVRLAGSDLDPNAAFAVGGCAWGVQFHPEFDAEITRAYIVHFQEALLAEGKNPEELFESVSDSPHGPRLLKRFAQLVTG